MKTILIDIAGSADVPTDELGGKTPLEVAKIPNLNYFTKVGKAGQVKLMPDRFEPSSDISFLSLLGYDAEKIYTGRGPLEAANLELKLEDNEVAFRMNFITEADGVMADAKGGNLSTKEAKALINFLNKKVSSDFVRFFPGSNYRHIAVLKDSHGFEALSAKTQNPEGLAGDRIDGNLPKGPGEELLKKLMYDAKLLLQDHEINQVRVDLNENPANMIWLWGQGRKPALENFTDMYGVTGCVLSEMEYVKGIARLASMTVMDMDGSEDEEPEVRYGRYARRFAEAAREKNFVCLHFDACDDASMAGDYKAKISALEAIDFFVLSKVREFLEAEKDVRVIVTSAHCVPWKQRKHNREYVPFVVAGKNVMADDYERFSETASRTSAFKISKGPEFLKSILAK